MLDGAAVAGYQWKGTVSAVIVKIPACGKEPKILV
jgi:hypothetical protein